MQAPSTLSDGDRIDYSSINGSLLYFTITEFVIGVPTIHGPSDAVKANVVVLDGALKGKAYDDVLVFPKVMRAQLCPGGRIPADPVIVARLGQGQAKQGKSAPWMLMAPSADDLLTAQRYEAAMAAKTPAPKPTAAAAADEAW